MIAVRFNDPGEFADELRAGVPEMRILRLTKQFQMTQFAFRHLYAIATFLRKGEIIRLEHYCGQIWGIEFDRKFLHKADAILDDLTKIAEELGLEVRAGVYEE